MADITTYKHFVFLSLFVFGYSFGSVLEKELKESGYSKRIRPYATTGKPVHVKNQIFVLKLTSINEHDFTYEISYFIRQWWKDPRLASNDTTRTTTYHQPPEELIWVPGITLKNSDKNERVKGNVQTNIDLDGNVFLSQRMKAKCSCEMDLSLYPMDTQYCPFELESYAYPIEELRLDWDKKPVKTKENMDLSGYSLINIIHEKQQAKYTAGNGSDLYDNLIVKFVVKRTFLYYLYRAYIPIMLLMVFNIGSYWVPDTALPGRVTLIVTTFLTNTFILQSVSEQTVRVSSTTSLQVFIVVNIIMIVIAIIEYLTVLHLKTKAKFEAAKTAAIAIIEYLMVLHLKTRTKFEAAKTAAAFKNDGYQLDVMSSVSPAPTSESVLAADKKPKSEVHRLDTIFRFTMPVVYLVFCIVYFAYYLG